MLKTIPHFINGQLVEGNANKYLDVYNPALGEVIARVSVADQNTVNQAVSLASKAFKSWSQVAPIKRARIFFKFNELLNNNIDQLAEIVTLEHGKTLEDARGSVMRGIEVVEHCCGIASHLQGTFSNNVSSSIDAYSIRQPLGVCAGVSPFNFPVMVPVWMFMPAIACGNTFVLKPSEKVPSAALFMADLLKQAGLPDGVFNIVNGHKETVDALLNHPEIKATAAVGSTKVVEYIYKTSINNNKRSHTFGGAKNHCIVMPDVDLDSVANAISGAAFGAAGERCMALSVALVVGSDDRYNKLINIIKEKAEKIKVGPGNDPSVDIGPLITKEHLNKILGYIESGIAQGADLVLDGRHCKVKGYERGFFLAPSIFTNVTPEMTIYKEEIFGPVLVTLRVANYEQALDLINSHEYGNGTAIFTNNMNFARKFANEVQAGMVGINIPIPVPFVTHSFGGWKNSIFGDLGLHANQSIHFYTKSKSITVANAKVDPDYELSSKSTLSMPVHG